jgi:serine/threonine-protein kinase
MPPSTFPGQDAATMRMMPTYQTPTVAPSPTGERHIGKYIVKRELGRGGMGAVYLAEQPGLGREVAIKELVPSAAADPTALKRFLQEAQVMARFSHPNLVQLHDMEQIGAANYIVLEFVRGKSLRDWLNRGEIPLPQVFAVMHGVLQALDYAHRHAIVHRDMKPENVLLSDEGAVKVADFGIARLTDDSAAPGQTATKTGTTVGTPQYMSPEQVASSKVDGRSDLYSAGIMFYELIVGQPPFTATEADGPFTLMAKHVQAPPKPPSVHKPGLDMRLEEVILKALSKRPEERYQSGQEFDEAVTRVADRLCPGWQKSLEPGADLSKMVPGAAAVAVPSGALPAMAMPTGSPPPIQAVYNPTPPVKPAAKKQSAGCMSVMLLALALASIAATLATLVH